MTEDQQTAERIAAIMPRIERALAKIDEYRQGEPEEEFQRTLHDGTATDTDVTDALGSAPFLLHEAADLLTSQASSLSEARAEIAELRRKLIDYGETIGGAQRC